MSRKLFKYFCVALAIFGIVSADNWYVTRFGLTIIIIALACCLVTVTIQLMDLQGEIDNLPSNDDIEVITIEDSTDLIELYMNKSADELQSKLKEFDGYANIERLINIYERSGVELPLELINELTVFDELPDMLAFMEKRRKSYASQLRQSIYIEKPKTLDKLRKL